MSAPVLALISLAAGVPDRGSLEAASLARGIAREARAPLEAVLVADPASGRSAAASLAGLGLSTAIVVEHPELTLDHPDGWAAAKAVKPTIRQLPRSRWRSLDDP